MVRLFALLLLLGLPLAVNASGLLCQQVYDLAASGPGLQMKATHWNVFQMEDGNEIGLVLFHRKNYNMPQPEAVLVGSFYIQKANTEGGGFSIPAQQVKPLRLENDGDDGVRMIFLGRTDSLPGDRRPKITVRIAAEELVKDHPAPTEIIFEIETVANGSSKVLSVEKGFRYQASDVAVYRQRKSMGLSETELAEIVPWSEVFSSSKTTTAEIDSTIRALAIEGKLERSFWDVYLKLQQEVPAAFNHFHTAHKRNLIEHAEKHRREFGAPGWMTYEKLAASFARDRDAMDLYAVFPDQVVKFNLISGNFLILNRHNGNFITFFRLKTDSSGERLLMFLSKMAYDSQRPGKQLL